MPFSLFLSFPPWALSLNSPCLAVSLLYTLLHLFLCFFSFSPLHLVDTVSFLWPAGQLVALVTFCTAAHLCFVTWADVAHHRAQHALNKPSNSKAPQGTSLSATLLTPCQGCQLLSTNCQPNPFPVPLATLHDTTVFACLHFKCWKCENSNGTVPHFYWAIPTAVK